MASCDHLNDESVMCETAVSGDSSPALYLNLSLAKVLDVMLRDHGCCYSEFVL